MNERQLLISLAERLLALTESCRSRKTRKDLNDAAKIITTIASCYAVAR